MGEWSNHAVPLSHFLLKQVIEPGDHVCDATAGNGKDTVFLAKLVGPEGRVFAIDIQNVAIENTKNRLAGEGLEERVKLFCGDHAELKQFLGNTTLKAVTFNLGYLPGGDHQLTTTAKQTIKAISTCLDLLVAGGAVSVVAYAGHPGGSEETSAVLKYLSELPQPDWDVLSCCYPNQRRDPPQLLFVRKGRGEFSYESRQAEENH